MFNNNNKAKLYLIATVSRSFDKYHVKNKLIHLISSIFYTEKDYISNISKIKIDTHLIIRVLYRSDDFFQVIEHNTNSIEFQCSLTHLINVSISSGFENFINSILGSYNSEGKIGLNILNNVYFIFEDLNWFSLQLLFKLINIKISGGSITRRAILSTSQYSLSLFLLKLGYKVEDIFNSINYIKDIYYNNNDYDKLFFSKELLLLYINNNVKDSLENIISNKALIEKEINHIKENILNISSLTYKNKNINKSNKNIYDLNRLLDLKVDYLNLLNSKEIKLNQELITIKTFSLEQLKEFYFKNYHNEKVVKDKIIFNNYIDKIKNNNHLLRSSFSKPEINKRSYSTLSLNIKYNHQVLLSHLNKNNNLLLGKTKVLNPLDNTPTSTYNSISYLINYILIDKNSGNGNSFIVLDQFKEFLSTLTVEELGALSHILLWIAMLFSVSTIVFVIFGDFLIIKFKLEEKYPKLARFIQLRRKVQYFSLISNIILIVLSLLVIIYLNVLVFMK